MLFVLDLVLMGWHNPVFSISWIQIYGSGNATLSGGGEYKCEHIARMGTVFNIQPCSPDSQLCHGGLGITKFEQARRCPHQKVHIFTPEI